jgi:hypothetical protein
VTGFVDGGNAAGRGIGCSVKEMNGESASCLVSQRAKGAKGWKGRRVERWKGGKVEKVKG